MIALASPEWTPLPYTGESGLYCAVQPDDGSKFRIMRLCEELGVTTDHRKLHCTLVYSRNDAPPLNEIQSSIDRASFGRINFIEYWPGHDKKGYLVAKLVSDKLQAFHERLIRSGARHSFTPYSPHVTLTTGLPLTEELESNIKEVNRRLSEESIYVNFDDFTISDIKKD
jgi:2'-5' RNA ligase